MKNSEVLAFTVLCIFSFLSCDTKDKKYSKEGSQLQSQDSISIEMKDKLKDTISYPGEPIQIISSVFLKKKNSDFKDIRISYKNISGKDVASIRVKWYGINASGGPSTMGPATDGIGGGFSGKGLKNGESNTSSWGMSSKDLVTLQKAWVHEVVFKDGTKWLRQ